MRPSGADENRKERTNFRRRPLDPCLVRVARYINANKSKVRDLPQKHGVMIMSFCIKLYSSRQPLCRASGVSYNSCFHPPPSPIVHRRFVVYSARALKHLPIARGHLFFLLVSFRPTSSPATALLPSPTVFDRRISRKEYIFSRYFFF